MSWTRRVKHPSKMVAVGDQVEAVVLDVNVKDNRISLGMKQLEPNPYEQLTEKYPPGTVVKGQVRNIADFGIFVEIEEGIDGLVHISDMSWTQRVKHPSELFQKGDEVEAVLLNIDAGDGDKPKISLGIKQLVPDPWDRIPYDFAVGKVVDGKVLKVLDFGAFVELEKGVEGLVHVSEISEDHVEDPRTVLTPGQDVKVQILHADQAERKIALSIKGASRAKEMADAQGYSGANAGGATLGDLMRGKIGNKKNKKNNSDEAADWQPGRRPRSSPRPGDRRRAWSVSAPAIVIRASFVFGVGGAAPPGRRARARAPTSFSAPRSPSSTPGPGPGAAGRVCESIATDVALAHVAARASARRPRRPARRAAPAR
ncbi:MAG: S1 RNA-binding domain-containing protein [Kofleriaceae bacterium]